MQQEIKTQVQDKIIQWVCKRQAELHGEATVVTAKTDLLTSGLLDSIEFLRLMTFIEEEYKLQIPVDLLAPDNFATPEAAGLTVESISLTHHATHQVSANN